MPVNFKVGSFQKSGSTTVPFTATTTGALTGLTFQPKAIIFMAIGASGTSVWTNTMRPGMGWTSSSTENFSVSWGSDDNQTTASNTFRRARNDYCLTLGSAGNAGTACSIKLSSFTSDGASLTYDLNDTATWHIAYIAIGGTDITNVKAGSFLPNTTTGNQTVTDPGFRPDIVFFMGGNSPHNPTTSTPHLAWFWGAATSSTEQGVTSIASVDEATTTSSGRYHRDDNTRCIHLFSDGSITTDGEASYVGAADTGFTINWTDAPSSQQPIHYLAIKGGSWKIGHFTQPSTAVSQTISGVPFTPKGVILSSAQDIARTAIGTHAKLAIGTADSSTSMWSTTHGDESGLATASTPTRTMRGFQVGSTSVLRTGSVEDVPSASTDVSGSCDFSAFTSTGFTLNWTISDGALRRIWYVAAGDNTVIIKHPATNPESVGITEALRTVKGLTRAPATNPESVGITESTPRALGRVRVPATNPESVGITESITNRLGKVRFPTTNPESVGVTELVVKKITSPIVTLRATSLQLRYSGGANGGATSISGGGFVEADFEGADFDNTTTTTGVGATDSIGGGISNNTVPNNALNATWDDISNTQSTTGVTEYRCFYLYNSDTSLTAYSVQMWIDSQTPAGDDMEIGVGTAAINGTEQGPLASETTAPTGVSFSTAPDLDSAIPLGDIPPLGYRSFWIKRIVPPNTTSWNDNTYVLRVSFVSNHL